MKNLVLGLLISGFLFSCQMDSKRDQGATGTPLVDAKYSVAKDRAELEKLRENIPPEIRQKNDESALLAELTAELKHPPEVVREKYHSVLRKKRELFNKDMTKAREQYNKDERKMREDFLKTLEEERKEFSKRKVDREKRAQFFNEQDEVRRNYFAEQREKREEFESDFREKRKNFEDYIKEKTDSFNAELKDYAQRWREREQAEKERRDADTDN